MFCFVRNSYGVQSIHTELADLYSPTAVLRFFSVADSCETICFPSKYFWYVDGIKRRNASLLLCSVEICFLKIPMALLLKTEDASETQDFESRPKIVKFAVVKKTESDQPEAEELVSFEQAMLPHLDAAHNLAKWLVRNDQDAQDVVQEAYLRAFRSFAGFRGSNGRAWLLTIVRNTAYTLLKKNRSVDLSTTFDEEVHVTGQESASPATILEHADNAELIRNAMDELPTEFREILTLRHQEDLSYKEIGEILKIPTGTVMSRLARARAKLKEYLTSCISQDR
jgi:RNA polymerase sigma factor (sigma-70 family)